MLRAKCPQLAVPESQWSLVQGLPSLAQLTLLGLALQAKGSTPLSQSSQSLEGLTSPSL